MELGELTGEFANMTGTCAMFFSSTPPTIYSGRVPTLHKTKPAAQYFWASGFLELVKYYLFPSASPRNVPLTSCQIARLIQLHTILEN